MQPQTPIPILQGSARIMVLGGGGLAAELMVALRDLGAEVIAVGSDVETLEQATAVRTHCIDMTDGKTLRKTVETEKPSVIVLPGGQDISMHALEEIEKGGLAEVIPAVPAARLAMDRVSMRRMAAEQLDLPTPRYGFAKSLNQLHMAIDGGVGYPCLVKPLSVSSGAGLATVRGPDQIEMAWENTTGRDPAQHGGVIVEEIIDFDFEMTLLTARALDKDGQIRTAFCEPIGHLQADNGDIEAWQPQHVNSRAKTHAHELAASVATRLGGRGIFAMELFVKGDRVWFSRLNPWPDKTGIVTMISQAQSEFELHARAILGLPINTTLRRCGAAVLLRSGAETSQKTSAKSELASYAPQTSLRRFDEPATSANYQMTVTLAYGNSTDDARSRARLAMSRFNATWPEAHRPR